MKPTQEYCIAYIAEGDIESYFKGLTTELADKFSIGNLSKRVPPHITIRYPFDSNENDIVLVEENLRFLVSNMKSVDFVVEGFEKFPDDHRTIFLNLIQNDELYSVMQPLAKELAGNGPREGSYADNYHPHISIARKLTPESFELVWNYLHELPKPRFELAFDNVAIMVLVDEVWTVKTLIRF